MKTLGILFAAIFVFSCMTLSVGGKEPHNKKTSEPYGWTFYCMCAGEELDVEGELITMEKVNGMQWIFNGTAVGATTGWLYDVKSVENLNELFLKGYIGTYTMTMTISLDGTRVATVSWKQHITQNANGEYTVVRLDGPYPNCGK